MKDRLQLKIIMVCFFVVLLSKRCQQSCENGMCQLPHAENPIPDYENVKQLNERLTKRVTDWGFVLETHEVFTEDGYGLKIHRLLKKDSKKLSPLLIMHGIRECGAVFLAHRMSIAYYMAERDYDVWVGNARGTAFSLKHKTLTPKQKKFWDFSIDEIGSKDVPAFIDKVRVKTGAERVHYVGFSMGSTVFLIMAVTARSKVKNEVASVTLIAPVAFPVHHRKINNKAKRFIATTALKAINLFSGGAFLTYQKKVATTIYNICKSKSFGRLCERFFRFGSRGEDIYDHVNSMESILFYPCGASIKSYLHFIQMAAAKKFQRFDYGEEMNYSKYYEQDSMEYDLHAIDKEIIILAGGQDGIADLEDVKMLQKQLPNSFYITKNLENFDHRDFEFSTQLRTPNEMILEVITAYNENRKPSLPLLKD